MRTIILVLLLLAAPLAQAQTPADQAYIAARKTAVADLDEKFDAQALAPTEEDQVKSRLQVLLLDALGPLSAPKGFSDPGKFNGATICCGMGAGALDGIAFESKGRYAVVTSVGILRLWLETDPKTTLEANDMSYDSALDRSAAVGAVIPLPIRLPAGATTAVAWLAVECNGECSLPQHLVLSVIKGDRAYIAMVDPVLPAATPPTACDAVWKEALDRYKTAYAAFDAARETPRAYDLLMTATRFEKEGGEAVEKCWKDRANGEPAFPLLTQQAQALADDFAAP